MTLSLVDVVPLAEVSENMLVLVVCGFGISAVVFSY